MRKLVVLPAVAAAATATVALGGGPAWAGTGNPPGCPSPTVTVSPSHSVAVGSPVTITGTNFGCKDAANQSYPVRITFYTGALASSERNTLSTTAATATNGKFSVVAHVPSGASAGSEVDVLAETTKGTDLTSVGSLTLAGSTGSLSVPAGHVDVVSGNGVSDLELALILVAGVGLVAAGATVAVRRRSA